MIIYFAGKITGNPEYRKQFAAAKKKLERDGHIVLNPAELPEDMSPAAHMRICFAMIDRGARLEMAYADYIGKTARVIHNILNGGTE